MWKRGKSMKFDFKILDIFKLPTRIMCVISIVTGAILFLPENFIRKTYMFNLRNNMGSIIGLGFYISNADIIVKIVRYIGKYYREKYSIKKFKKDTKKRLLELDDYQKNIVYSLYKKHNHTKELPMYDGAVVFLKQNLIISITANYYPAQDLEDPVIPFMLNPWVLEIIKNNKDLLSEFERINENRKKYN